MKNIIEWGLDGDRCPVELQYLAVAAWIFVAFKELSYGLWWGVPAPIAFAVANVWQIIKKSRENDADPH